MNFCSSVVTIMSSIFMYQRAVRPRKIDRGMVLNDTFNNI